MTANILKNAFCRPGTMPRTLHNNHKVGSTITPTLEIRKLIKKVMEFEWVRMSNFQTQKVVNAI